MLRNAIVVLLLILLALGVADARTPKVGDQVTITVAIGGDNYDWYEGQITDITDGLICLSVTNTMSRRASFPYDNCIGVGSILELIWR